MSASSSFVGSLGLALATLALSGCYTQIDVSDDAAVSDAPPDVSLDVPVDGPPDVPTAFDGGGALPRCGGTECAPGQICCRLDGRCIDPGDVTCAVPSGETDPDACVSHADCDPGELCSTVDDGSGSLFCSGRVGRCRPRLSPTECDPGEVCGCDGRTYPTGCAADEVGVHTVGGPCGSSRVAGPTQPCEPGGACGENGHCDDAAMMCVWEDLLVVCGDDDTHCPSGEVCCAITGYCHDPSVAGTCAVPPGGTVFPCASQTDCDRYDGSHWPMGSSRYFCDAETCDGPGGCRLVTSTCEGTVDEVCGCDGNTYQNVCEAGRARVRVAHDGQCE